MYNTLLFEEAEGIATITLNRPQVYNAISDEMGRELQDALAKCQKNPAIRAIILAGGEGKAFSSGQDLKEAQGVTDGTYDYYGAVQRKYNPIVKAMRNMPKPIIAAVNGVAAGAGCSLALCADYIIAAENAVFTELFINIGLVPDTGSVHFVPRMTGGLRAFELFTTGRRVNAQEALQIGLCTEVCPTESLAERAKAVAKEYAQRPTAAIGLIKKMLNQSLNQTLDQNLETEALYQQAAGQTADHIEGVKSFLEKRVPVFQGK